MGVSRNRIMVDIITITESAKSQIGKLRDEANLNDTYNLRVQVIAGGCSGLSYKLDFDDTVNDNDEVHTINGVNIVVDNRSVLYIMDTQLDYSSGLNGKGFEFNNPNATRTCGCGESFAI